MKIRKSINRLVITSLCGTLLMFGLAAAAQAQAKNTGVQETEDKVKVDLYTKFVDNYKTNQPMAYQTAKDYLKLYAKENDQYSRYVQLWVANYEREDRIKKLHDLVYVDRNFAEAFKLGKQVMSDDPNHLDSLIALGNAGYLATSARNETFNTEALTYSQKAIRMIEEGKSPDSWEPFKGKS